MNIILDIETFSRHSAVAIISIGSVVFNPNTGLLADEFYRVVDMMDTLRYDLSDEEALAWWDKQGEEAKATLNPDEGL